MLESIQKRTVLLNVRCIPLRLLSFARSAKKRQPYHAVWSDFSALTWTPHWRLSVMLSPDMSEPYTAMSDPRDSNAGPPTGRDRRHEGSPDAR